MKPPRKFYYLFVLIGWLIVLWGNYAEGSRGKTSFSENQLSIKWDPLTGAPLTVRGEKTPLLEIGDVSGLSRTQVTRTGSLLVKKYASIFKIQPDQLKLKSADRVSGSWYLSYWQTFKGLIIYESSLGFSIDPKGRVVSIGAILYPGVQVPEKSLIDRERALKTAMDRIPDFKKFDYRVLAESRLIYPERKAERIDFYQVYAFNFFPQKALHPASPIGGWAVLVDTQTGRPVLVQTLFKPMGCCVPENWTPPKIEDDHKGIFGN